MASSTFSDIPTSLNERNSQNNTLIIIVNNDGTLSVDQETLHNLLAEQENTSSTTSVRLIRLGVAPDDCSQNSSDSEDSNSSHVNITVEGYYPPSIGQLYQHNEDAIDPFLGMDPEEMERLESALQSDEAKHILGEDVAAMMDILTVENSMKSSQLHDSIMMDHCYTNRVASPTQFKQEASSVYSPLQQAKTVPLKSVIRSRKDTTARKTATPNLVMVQQVQAINPTRLLGQKGKKSVVEKNLNELNKTLSGPNQQDSILSSGSILKKSVQTKSSIIPPQAMSITEEMLNEKLQEIQDSTDDYGDGLEEKSDSSADPNADVEDFVAVSVLTQEPNVAKSIVKDERKHLGLKGHHTVSGIKRLNDGERIQPTILTLKHPHKSQIDSKVGVKKSIVKVYSKKKLNTNPDASSKQVDPPASSLQKTVEDINHASLQACLQASKTKYPKRENRKPPAHLLEVYNGPPLFSVMDVPRRVSLDAKATEARRELEKTLESSNVPHFDSDYVSNNAEGLSVGDRMGDIRHSSNANLIDGEGSRRLSSDKPASIQSQSPRLSVESLDATYALLNTEDDPDKLWCICKKPHNNRFMICCDSCEDWFHGKCVGVTKASGKTLEERGKEWTCPNCKKNKKKENLSQVPSKKQTKITTFLSSNPILPVVPVVAPPSVANDVPGTATFCIVCKKQARNNSIYCSDTCILKHAQDSDPTSKNTAPRTPIPTSSHFKHVDIVTPAKELHLQVTKVIKKTVPIVAGPSTSQASTLGSWLKVSPNAKMVAGKSALTSQTSQVNQTITLKSPESDTKPKQAQMIAPKHMAVPAPKSYGKQTPTAASIDSPTKQSAIQSSSSVYTPLKSPTVVTAKEKPSATKRKSHVDSPKRDEPIRINVRKTLFELIQTRIQECDDLKSIPDDKIKKMTFNIEDELYSYFKDTGIKYKSKYRSLIFNIKDPKNLTLFRKIAEKSVTPYQLVRLSPEELASQELAQWRERESKHQLEMIKKNELDLLNLSKTYVMKTHKGEQVIESEDGVKKSDPVQLENLDSLDNFVSSQNSVSSTVSDINLIGAEEKIKIIKKGKRKRDDYKRSKSHKGSRDRSKGKRKDGKSHSKSSHTKNKHHKSRESDRKKSSSISENKVAILKAAKNEDEDMHKSMEEEVLETAMDDASIKEILFGKQFEDSNADLEPTSTVTIKTPDISDDTDTESNLNIVVWKGFAEMPEVAKFYTTIQVVSGDSQNHCETLPNKLDIVGRISPDLVWEHVSKMKKTGSYEIMVVRLTATNENEKIPYVTLYSYLNTRNRLGVVGVKGVVGPVSSLIKDFYILPLSNHSPVPQVLLPLNGPGLEDNRPHLLLGILVARTSKKRVASVAVSTTPAAKISRLQDSNDVTTARSYTPPLPEDPDLVPTLTSAIAKDELESSPNEDRNDEKMHDKESEEDEDEEDDDEPYSPGDTNEVDSSKSLLSTKASSTLDLERKMEELNRKIAEQKKEIENITSIVGESSAIQGLNPLGEATRSSFMMNETKAINDEDEAYSPSTSLSPPQDTIPFIASSLKTSKPNTISKLPQDISLPLNLHEILANVKKQSDSSSKLDIKLDPIVQSYTARKEEKREKSMELTNILGKRSSSSSHNTSTKASSKEILNIELPSVKASPKSQELGKTTSTLSKLSDAELIEKAAAMEMEMNCTPIVSPVKKTNVQSIKKSPIKYGTATTDFLQTPLLNIPMPPSSHLGSTSLEPKPPGVDDDTYTNAYLPYPPFPSGFNVPPPSAPPIPVPQYHPHYGPALPYTKEAKGKRIEKKDSHW